MDKKWMFSNRLSKDYENGVFEFVKFFVENTNDPSRITCPCLYCCYGCLVDAIELESHLKRHGIDQSYTCWILHDEISNKNDVDLGENMMYASNEYGTETYKSNSVEEIAEALKQDLQDCPKMFEALIDDS